MAGLNEIIFSDSPFAEFALNVYLVARGRRDACLLESANIWNQGISHIETMEEIGKLLVIAEKLGLKWLLENKKLQRYLVYNPNIKIPKPLTDDDLARLLGFPCIGHNFSNYNVDRTAVSININISDGHKSKKFDGIIAFYCETSKVNKKKLKSYVVELCERLGHKTDITASFEIEEEIGLVTRVHKLADYNFVQKHQYWYLNDIYNFWIEGRVSKLFYLPKKDYLNFVPFLTLFYSIFINHNLVELLQSRGFSNEKIDEFMSAMEEKLDTCDTLETIQSKLKETLKEIKKMK